MIVPALGFFFGCLVTALFFAWLDDRRRAAEAAGWAPQREAFRVLASTSPRPTATVTDGPAMSHSNLLARSGATFERSHEPLVGSASTAARESSPRFGSRAVPLNR